MALDDLPTPVTPHVFLRGNPNNPRPGGAAAVPRSPGRRQAQAVQGRQRPAGTGPRHRQQGQPADGPRAWSTASGCTISARAWCARPATSALRGDPPTHPELLDWLAATFMDDGWSIKKMHRLILLSNTYQQDERRRRRPPRRPTRRIACCASMNRHRLDFEPLRDALLFVAGRARPAHGRPGRRPDATRPPFSHRRTVYGFIDRQNLPGLFRTFDFASPDAHSRQRTPRPRRSRRCS